METYLVSYDLGIPETSEDYKKVINYIKSFPSWAKPLYSVWLVRSNISAAQIRNDLSKLIDSNDRILVIRVTNTEWASWNISKDVTDWMYKNL